MTSSRFVLPLLSGLLAGPLLGQSSDSVRTVRFETTEGTAMNVDVSPNGKTIVFDLLGDLYTVPIDGGTATRLTSGPAFDTEPQFSPDGRRIAFVSDRSGSDNIWLVDTDGRNVNAFTTETTAAVTSPMWVVGGEIQLVARKADEYWLYRADGQGTALQSHLNDDTVIGPEAGWSRDGRFLYVAEATPLRYALWRVDIARGISEVVSEGWPGALRPTVSPDGKWVAFGGQRGTRTGLRLLNVETSEDRWLIDRLPERDGSTAPALSRFAFTPDGKAIILAAGGTLQRLDVRTGALRPIRFRAVVEQELRPAVVLTRTLPGRPDSIRVTDHAQYDRAGARTVFSSLGRIWIREGNEPVKPLMEQSPATRHRLEREPVLSPDGRWVAFVSWHDVEGGQLWRVAARGGMPRQLTRLRGVYRHPVWSPDGSLLAVVREEEHPDWNGAAPLDGQIYVVPASGGMPRRVGAISADERPAFAADGTTVITTRAASAADVTPITFPVPRPALSGSVALEGATVITMRGDEVLRDATVLVTGTRIAAVGPRGSMTLPRGVHRIDVTGKTIIPGLIDVRGAVPLARDLLEGTNIPLAANLAFGVTTVRAFPASDGMRADATLETAARYAELLETGTMTGARLLGAGAVTAAEAAELTSLEAARALVERQRALGATTLAQLTPLARRQRQWLAAAAREAGIALVGTSDNLRLALTMVADGYHTIQGSIPNAYLYADVRRLLAASEAVYVPTLLTSLGGGWDGGTAEEYFLATTALQPDPKLRLFGLGGRPSSWRALEDYAFLPVGRQAARLQAMGVPVTAGTEGHQPGRGIHWEMWALRKAGFSAHAALRAATATAAAALGLEHELGTIEVGKVADLVVLDADPLADLQHSSATRYVMRNGELFDATTLAMIWPHATPPLPVRDRRYDPPTDRIPAAPERIVRAASHATAPASPESMQPTATSERNVGAHGVGDQMLIKPARTISFETTEATDMHLDLSPDGRTLVFDLLGDIYTMPVTGGTPTQLTRGLGHDQRPVWSPDGTRIAFFSDATGEENAWVMAADGSDPRPVAAKGTFAHGGALAPVHVEWTPDGRSLLSRNTLYHLAGGKQRLDALPPDFDVFSSPPRFSRDGRYLYFSYDGIRRYDRTTGETIQLARPPVLFEADAPVVSPDGRWLAYVTRPREMERYNGLRLRDLETGEDRWLAYPTAERGFRQARYVFTHDSKAILIAYGGKLHRIDVATGADEIVPFTANVNVDLGRFIYHRQRLTNDSLPIRYIRAPAVSPDRKTLVFAALHRLYRMALPNGTPTPLVEQAYGQFQPAYSPDGKWIAYVTWSDEEGGHVWRIPAAGGTPERLTTIAGYYLRPTWSPDGKTIALLKAGTKDTRPTNAQAGWLQLLPSTGGVPRTIAAGVSTESQVVFSADGRRVYFQERHGRAQENPVLSSVRLDGRDHHVRARVAGRAFMPGPTVPSPDGRYVAYVLNHELYLAFPGEQRDSVTLGDSAAVPVVRLMHGALDPRWEQGGRWLTWVVANRVFRLDAERALAGVRDTARATPNDTIIIRLTQPRYLGHGTVALRGARVITMKGDEVLEDATVVITDDRITAVGPASSVTIPKGAKIVDVRGKTIMPGLIDMHAHLGWRTDEILIRSDWVYRANLAYGVTTARDPSAPTPQFGEIELIETGRKLGPRIVSSGWSIDNARIETLEEARAVVQTRRAMGAGLIKQRDTEHRGWRQLAFRAANEAGFNITSERARLDLILDGSTGMEHQLPANRYGDWARLAAEAGIWYTPALGSRQYFRERYQSLRADPKFRRLYPPERQADFRSGEWERPGVDDTWLVFAKDAAEIVHQGGNVTIGSHGDDPGLGVHWDLWAMQRGGLTNHEALQSATIRGAEGLGMQRDLGSIEVGKIADLLVLDRNPLEDIEHTLTIRYVMKNGVLYDGDTLDIP